MKTGLVTILVALIGFAYMSRSCGLTAWLMGAAAIIGLALCGCAQSEMNRVAQDMVLVSQHAQIAEALHIAGVTNHTEEVTISELLHAEKNASNAYYTAITAGDSTAMATAKATLAAATTAAAVELSKYNLPAPTTAPAH